MAELLHKEYNAIYRRYQPAVIGFVNTYLNDVEESRNIAQNTFLRLWEKRYEIEKYVSIKSFIFTVAKNLTLDYLKAKSVRVKYFNETREYKQYELELNIEALTRFDTEVFEKKRKLHKVRQLVMKLPLSDRKIFILSKYNNLTYNEISELLGISSKTVEKRISISLKFLKKNIYIVIVIIS